MDHPRQPRHERAVPRTGVQPARRAPCRGRASRRQGGGPDRRGRRVLRRGGHRTAQPGRPGDSSEPGWSSCSRPCPTWASPSSPRSTGTPSCRDSRWCARATSPSPPTEHGWARPSRAAATGRWSPPSRSCTHSSGTTPCRTSSPATRSRPGVPMRSASSTRWSPLIGWSPPPKPGSPERRDRGCWPTAAAAPTAFSPCPTTRRWTQPRAEFANLFTRSHAMTTTWPSGSERNCRRSRCSSIVSFECGHGPSLARSLVPRHATGTHDSERSNDNAPQ